LEEALRKKVETFVTALTVTQNCHAFLHHHHPTTTTMIALNSCTVLIYQGELDQLIVERFLV
jgi:hypothetical protein